MIDPLAEPFVGILKLVTGEELISWVAWSEEDNVVMLQNPMIVIEANRDDDYSIIKGFKLDLWMKSAMEQDEFFLLNSDKIITVTEANESIGKFYEESISMVFRNSSTNRIKPTSDMGHVGLIDEYRLKFEKLYRNWVSKGSGVSQQRHCYYTKILEGCQAFPQIHQFML